MVETKKVELPKMTLRFRRISKQQGTRGMVANTRLMSITSLKLDSGIHGVELKVHRRCPMASRTVLAASLLLICTFLLNSRPSLHSIQYQLPLANNPFSSKASTICLTASSIPVSPLLITTSALSGSSYGALTPVKSGISPLRAFAYKPLGSLCSAIDKGT